MSEEKETEKKIASIYYLLFSLFKSYERWWRSIVVRSTYPSSRVLVSRCRWPVCCSVTKSKNLCFAQKFINNPQSQFCLVLPTPTTLLSLSSTCDLCLLFFIIYLFHVIFLKLFLHCVWRKNTDFFLFFFWLIDLRLLRFVWISFRWCLWVPTNSITLCTE